jgi:hypothetical protein
MIETCLAPLPSRLPSGRGHTSRRAVSIDVFHAMSVVHWWVSLFDPPESRGGERGNPSSRGPRFPSDDDSLGVGLPQDGLNDGRSLSYLPRSSGGAPLLNTCPSLPYMKSQLARVTYSVLKRHQSRVRWSTQATQTSS